jgi:hypothetical protein
MSTEDPRPPTDEHDRFLIGCSLIQSGYVDQDEGAPGWFDIVQWHPCFEEANCRARNDTGPCACSGVPFISDEVWKEMGRAVDKIRAEAYARGISEGRRQATEGWERHLRWRTAEGSTMDLIEPNVATYVGMSRRLERQYGYAPGELQQRLVGPWKPAEQPEPASETNTEGDGS